MAAPFHIWMCWAKTIGSFTNRQTRECPRTGRGCSAPSWPRLRVGEGPVSGFLSRDEGTFVPSVWRGGGVGQRCLSLVSLHKDPRARPRPTGGHRDLLGYAAVCWEAVAAQRPYGPSICPSPEPVSAETARSNILGQRVRSLRLSQSLLGASSQPRGRQPALDQAVSPCPRSPAGI